MTAEERAFLKSLEDDPADTTTRAAYADWLDEHNRPYEAAVQRGHAGLSEVLFKVRRKSDGLFSEGRPPSSHTIKWSAKGKPWRRAMDVRAHMLNLPDRTTYGGTPWDDVEVVMQEVRVVFAVTLPVPVATAPRLSGRGEITITEPIAESVEGDS